MEKEVWKTNLETIQDTNANGCLECNWFTSRVVTVYETNVVYQSSNQDLIQTEFCGVNLSCHS